MHLSSPGAGMLSQFSLQIPINIALPSTCALVTAEKCKQPADLVMALLVSLFCGIERRLAAHVVYVLCGIPYLTYLI